MYIIPIINTDQKLYVGPLEGLGENDFLVHRVIRSINNNSRIYRKMHYKCKSGVNKSTRKIVPQKRTGRARQGAASNPHMRGGAVNYGLSGVKERDYFIKQRKRLKVNQKEKAQGLKIVIKNKLDNNLFYVLGAYSDRTRDNFKIVDECGVSRSSFALVYASSDNVDSFRNLKNCCLHNVLSINCLKIVSKKSLLLTQAAAEAILNKVEFKFEINK